MNVVEGIKIDNDGGVVFSGNTELGAGQGDLFLAKTDANGNLYCNSVISSQTITNILLTSSSVSMTAINDLVATPISLSSARGATLNTFCEDLAMTVKQNPSLISSLGVSPNPSSNFVVITIPQSLYTNDLTLEITSFLGQTLVKSEVNEVSSKISVSKLPNGIYNIRLKNKVGETMATSKFIKN